MVNILQSKNILNALIDKKVPIELHEFPDEGHGFKNNLVNIDVLDLTEHFFAKHLGISF